MFERLRERRSMALRDPDGWRDFIGTRTRSGVIVNAETALGHPAVLGAVRLLAELTASLPIVVYERTDTGRRRAEEHPVYKLLHDAPNPVQTPFTFKETLVLHLLTYGHAPVQIIWRSGKPEALWPIHPSRLSVDTTGGAIRYKMSGPNGVQEIAPTDIIDVLMLSDDGITGRSPIDLARESIGAAIAAEELAEDYFANNAQPSGILTHPGRLSPEVAERLKKSWQAAHGGNGRQGTAVLEEGVKFEPISATAQQAQLIEARQYATQSIAAALRIPPHLLDPTARGTYANVETQSLEFLTFSLQPMLTRIEEALQRKLFTPQEPFYCEFLTDSILRTDTSTRYNAYKTGIEGGWLTVDEVRQRENLPPLQQAVRSEEPPVEVRAKTLQDQLEALLSAAVGGVIQREITDIRTITDQRADLEQLTVAINDYYAQSQWIADEMQAPIQDAVNQSAQVAMQEQERAASLGILSHPLPVDLPEVSQAVAARVLADYLREHINVSKTQLFSAIRGATDDAQMSEALDGLFAEWQESRPAKAAAVHATVARNDAALEIYRKAGATKLRWASSPGCDFCRQLNGKVVGIGEPFVGIGEPIAGPGGRTDRPMVARYPRIRPPIHLACKCHIEIAG